MSIFFDSECSTSVSVDGLKLHKFVSAAPYGVLRAPPQPPAGSPGRKGSLGVRPAGLGYLLPHFGRPVARAVGGAFTARGCLKLHNLFPSITEATLMLFNAPDWYHSPHSPPSYHQQRQQGHTAGVSAPRDGFLPVPRCKIHCTRDHCQHGHNHLHPVSQAVSNLVTMYNKA